MKKIIIGITIVLIAAQMLFCFTQIDRVWAKYFNLRKIYNEVLIADITWRVGKMPDAEAKQLRAAVEKSEPKFVTETAVDVGVIKDASGEWKVKK